MLKTEDSKLQLHQQLELQKSTMSSEPQQRSQTSSQLSQQQQLRSYQHLKLKTPPIVTTSSEAQTVLNKLFNDEPDPKTVPLRRRSLPTSFWSFAGQQPKPVQFAATGIKIESSLSTSTAPTPIRSISASSAIKPFVATLNSTNATPPISTNHKSPQIKSNIMSPIRPVVRPTASFPTSSSFSFASPSKTPITPTTTTITTGKKYNTKSNTTNVLPKKSYTIKKGRLCTTPSADCEQMPAVPEKGILQSPVKTKTNLKGFKPKLPRTPRKTGGIDRMGITKPTQHNNKQSKKKALKLKQIHQQIRAPYGNNALSTTISPRAQALSLSAKKKKTAKAFTASTTTPPPKTTTTTTTVATDSNTHQSPDVRGLSPASSEDHSDSLGMYDLGLQSPFITPTPDDHRNAFELSSELHQYQPMDEPHDGDVPLRSQSCPTFGYDFDHSMLMDVDDHDFSREGNKGAASAAPGMLAGSDAFDLLLNMDAMLEEEELQTDLLPGLFSDQPAKFLVCPTPVKET